MDDMKNNDDLFLCPHCEKGHLITQPIQDWQEYSTCDFCKKEVVTPEQDKRNQERFLLHKRNQENNG